MKRYPDSSTLTPDQPAPAKPKSLIIVVLVCSVLAGACFAMAVHTIWTSSHGITASVFLLTVLLGGVAAHTIQRRGIR